MKDRAVAKDLAAASLAAGDGTGWFDRLYEAAEGDASVVPWADLAPNPRLMTWLGSQAVEPGMRVLVVGCGLGDDAEALAALGASVTAFDISPACVRWVKGRFADSPVTYVVADLLEPPQAWEGGFDLIVEIYTLQAMPGELRKVAFARLPGLLAPEGRLLVICRGREEGDPVDGPPWPLTVGQLGALSEAGLVLEHFDDFQDGQDATIRRFLAVYRRPGARAEIGALSAASRDRVMEMEGMMARRRLVSAWLLNLDGYERWGNASPEDMDRAWKDSGISPGEDEALDRQIAAALGALRKDDPEAVRAWAHAHVRLLEGFMGDLEVAGSTGTQRFVAAGERAQWLEVAEDGRDHVQENTYYVQVSRARHEAIFGFALPG